MDIISRSMHIVNEGSSTEAKVYLHTERLDVGRLEGTRGTLLSDGWLL